ncbi:50S ribosomal protein L19 [Candidatus Woesebacteria bacterium RIFCSPHIGHO2_01_FULL_38_9]|uniref:50S ribosomal protein L19 n=2 Tax=Candidatus Woeseibacteriota TaxID=1752722 RepID=A0A1F7Y4D4_9BACT|nr:MAG: 50S ribosomal protein L19 [Candidatus Woesebacteria bacterium RIFCSPHIGHO2_01_FULL_38_9]OGM58261.1 MAG: 50S ribosomal protein L19 [Candidatus Woesebacteria bacterium RIFCSPLOWO2_01_FULL_39_10]
MSLTATHKEVTFGVGDKVKVTQKIKEGEKVRSQIFEGLVLGIKGREENKSFTVRRIGAQQIGIERIFPLFSPTVEKIEVTRNGTAGVSRAKLYYTREKAKREIDIIYSRANRRRAKSNTTDKKLKTRKKTSK